MPTIIPHGTGFTHAQVFTNSIGMAELQVTSFHCGPILADWGGLSLATVVKKCVFRAVPGNDFAVLHKKRMVFQHAHFSNNGYFDELLGFLVPHFVPQQLRQIVDELRYFLKMDDQRATAIATYINPNNFSEWFMSFTPTMIRVLCNGLLVVQLPKKPIIGLPSNMLIQKFKRERKSNDGKKLMRRVRKKRPIKRVFLYA